MTQTDPPVGARQVTVAVARIERWIDGFGERHGRFTASGDERVLLTGSDGARAWLELPWLPRSCADAPSDDGVPAQDQLGALIADATRALRIGVILVRRGGHAVGVFDGPELIASKVGTSYVQGTTKAGGWSQHRYANRRDNQAAAAFATAADVAARILLPDVGRLDVLVRGGDRAAVDAVLADQRLAPLRSLHTGPLLAVPDPRLRVLQAAPKQFQVVRISLVP
ncbi:MAG: acVLRF1 family peptidyl-tRNA hydrolase [Jatrophihabitantaceae bacterium]